MRNAKALAVAMAMPMESAMSITEAQVRRPALYPLRLGPPERWRRPLADLRFAAARAAAARGASEKVEARP